MFPIVKTADAVVTDGNTTLAIARTDGKKGKSGLCIVVPVVSDAVYSVITNSEWGKAWIVDSVDSLRSRMASQINAKGETITAARLGIDAIESAMRQELESQRITMDSIGKWFDADLAGLIAGRIRSKTGNAASDTAIAKMVSAYREKFQSLAGRNVSMSTDVKLQLLAALELLTAAAAASGTEYESVIGSKVADLLDKAQEATEMLAAL